MNGESLSSLSYSPMGFEHRQNCQYWVPKTSKNTFQQHAEYWADEVTQQRLEISHVHHQITSYPMRKFKMAGREEEQEKCETDAKKATEWGGSISDGEILILIPAATLQFLFSDLY